jgi:cobalt-zinc-cadmium efflux system protein
LAHSHSHAQPDNATLLSRAFLLIAGFMLVEVIGGLLANSLTLLADAGHMFLDASALGFSWYAIRISQREQDHRLSYGYHRWQVLAAFVNGLTLLGLVCWILIEALERLRHPELMLPLPALIVATLGLIVNLIAYRWLHHAEDNANVRAASLHVLGDILGSASAIIAALTVWFTGWPYADPLLALLIAVILGRGAWQVLNQSAHILLEGVPEGVNLETIAERLTAHIPAISNVHHLHAWALTAERPLVTLHAKADPHADQEQVVAKMKQVLTEEFGITHSTIQLEHGDCPDH